MKTPKGKTTKCPNCGSTFDIHENRSCKIRDGWFPIAFYDAMNQFENFNKVECPECKNEYKAPEARLFGVFKSPYSVFGTCLLFNALIFLYFYLTAFRYK